MKNSQSIPPSENYLINEHPGQMLKEDFLEPLGITAYRLAKATGLSQIHVSEIVRGQRSITPMTSLLFGKFLGVSPLFWLGLQNHYDVMEVQRSHSKRLDAVIPYAAGEAIRNR